MCLTSELGSRALTEIRITMCSCDRLPPSMSRLSFINKAIYQAQASGAASTRKKSRASSSGDRMRTCVHGMNRRLFPDQRHGAAVSSARHTSSSFVLSSGRGRLYCLVWANRLPVGPADSKSPVSILIKWSNLLPPFPGRRKWTVGDWTKGRRKLQRLSPKASVTQSSCLLTASIVIIESFVVSVSKVSSLFGRRERGE